MHVDEKYLVIDLTASYIYARHCSLILLPSVTSICLPVSCRDTPIQLEHAFPYEDYNSSCWSGLTGLRCDAFAAVEPGRRVRPRLHFTVAQHPGQIPGVMMRWISAVDKEDPARRRWLRDHPVDDIYICHLAESKSVRRIARCVLTTGIEEWARRRLVVGGEMESGSCVRRQSSRSIAVAYIAASRRVEVSNTTKDGSNLTI